MIAQEYENEREARRVVGTELAVSMAPVVLVGLDQCLVKKLTMFDP